MSEEEIIEQEGLDEVIIRVNEIKTRQTFPMAFSMLNRVIADTCPAREKSLFYRTQLGFCVWEYLTLDLPYEFSPAAYRAMRKMLRPHAQWVLDNCGDIRYYMDRAYFFLALTAEGTTEARHFLGLVGEEISPALKESADSLKRMLDEHEKACGVS